MTTFKKSFFHNRRDRNRVNRSNKAFLILLASFFIFILTTSSNFNIDEIRAKSTFNKRVNAFILNLTPDQMEYFLNNLPFVSHLLNEYGIHSLMIQTAGEKSYHAKDEKGLEGTFSMTKQEGRFHEYAGYGSISSRLLGKISAKVIATINFQETATANITNDLEFWVLVDNALIDILCRIFRPFLLQILNKKMENFINVAQILAQRVQTDPQEVVELLLKRGVDESEVNEFRVIFQNKGTNHD